MKAHSHENHAKKLWKNRKQKKQKVQTHGQGLGRGLAGDMGLNFFFVFPWFFAVWPKPRENQKKTKKQLKDRITPHVTNFFRLRLTIEEQEG